MSIPDIANLITWGVFGLIFTFILYFVFSRWLKLIVIKTWMHWILLFGFSVAVIYFYLWSIMDNY